MTDHYKGIAARGQRFCVFIKANGQYISMGVYDSADEAAMVYNLAVCAYKDASAYMNPVPVALPDGRMIGDVFRAMKPRFRERLLKVIHASAAKQRAE